MVQVNEDCKHFRRPVARPASTGVGGTLAFRCWCELERFTRRDLSMSSKNVCEGCEDYEPKAE